MLLVKNDCIICEYQPLDCYGFEAIDSNALSLFNIAYKYLSNVNTTGSPRLFILFECYLQISCKCLSLDIINSFAFHDICIEFLGALNSAQFINLSDSRRYVYSYNFMRLLVELDKIFPLTHSVKVTISTKGNTLDINECVSRFELLVLDEEKAWLWRGWKSSNRKGKICWFPLYPLYKKLGRNFCDDFYKVCDEYFSSHQADKIDCLKSFSEYIDQYSGALDPLQFKDQLFISNFWRSFFEYYIRSGYAKGILVVVLINAWRNSFICFIETYLIGSGLFAKPWGALPSPKPVKRTGMRAHITISNEGIEVNTKLITHIPLQISDDDAIKLLFKQIQSDYDLFIRWAEVAIKDIWKRYLSRRKLERKGVVRHIQQNRIATKNQAKEDGLLWLTNRENPDCIRNAAATFKYYGYLSNKAKIDILFPKPTSQTAIEFALPVTGALLPHCTVLVSTHPEITPSFLENLELFDKNGKLAGFIKTDGGYYLIGNKPRRGSLLAEQKILLNNYTRKVVRQIILLTDPLRKYLKQVNDDNWRYLLLTAQRGFAYPKRIRKLASDTSPPDRIEAIAHSLGISSSLSLETRRAYARQFSLPAMRATAAVLVYLKSGSAEKMSKALGHAKYDDRLLSSYLPEPLRKIFNERWIRIFQEGIIVEALKDSKHLLDACSFANINELDEFLVNHALRGIPGFLNDPYIKSKQLVDTEFSIKSEVVFGVNTAILTILLSLKIAVNQSLREVNAKALYWCSITDRLISYLESSHNNRKDLQSYLATAKGMVNPLLVSSYIYE